PEESAGKRRILSVVARADETQELWLEFRRTGDQKIRDRLILTYAPLVKYVAGRLGSGLPAHVDEGDLVSYGLLGLIGAIERFDPSRDIKFETYAIARIKGSIIDELRAMDWVPRSVRSRARDIERSSASSTARRPTRRSPRSSASPPTSWTTASPRSAAPRSRRSTSSGTSPPPAATRSPLSTPSRTPRAPSRSPSLRRR